MPLHAHYRAIIDNRSAKDDLDNNNNSFKCEEMSAIRSKIVFQAFCISTVKSSKANLTSVYKWAGNHC